MRLRQRRRLSRRSHRGASAGCAQLGRRPRARSPTRWAQRNAGSQCAIFAPRSLVGVSHTHTHTRTREGHRRRSRALGATFSLRWIGVDGVSHEGTLVCHPAAGGHISRGGAGARELHDD